MHDVRVRYPNLDDFLSTEFIQDPNDMRSLAEVVEDFHGTRPSVDVQGVAADIHRFLQDQHNALEAAFNGFEPQVNPNAYGCSIEVWLARIAILLERGVDE